ncbi:hypothetical protein AB1Y20_022117 [Prymnesium parvum]|uniref:BZIP domain-containing protein n=1 Tax=Prymnesium parvum TaxID=97485 RepID=A0AB34JGE3_PRYPA
MLTENALQLLHVDPVGSGVTARPPSSLERSTETLSPEVEAALFQNWADLEELAANPKTSGAQPRREPPLPRRDSTTDMFALLDIDGGNAEHSSPLRYQHPVGRHPLAGLVQISESDLQLDDPFDEWEDALGDTWMEAAMADRSAPGKKENDELIYAREVKYHRDRDFLNKYGWRRVIHARTGKVVYQHKESRWPEQPSVKAARRVMRAFFDERREQRRNPETMLKRRRGELNSENGGSGDDEGDEREGEEEGVALQESKEAQAVASVPVQPEVPGAPKDALQLQVPPDKTVSQSEVGTSPKRARTSGTEPAAVLPRVPAPAEVQQPGAAASKNPEPKEREEVDKQLRRKQKNRQAAATSRKRQQDYRHQLEEENKRLQEENAFLRKLLAVRMRGDTNAEDAIPDNMDELESANGTGTTLADPIEILSSAL